MHSAMVSFIVNKGLKEVSNFFWVILSTIDQWLCVPSCNAMLH